jgi:hypothetical protein
MTLLKSLLAFAALMLVPAGLLAQDGVLPTTAAPTLPPSYQLTDLRFEWQGWNNCGPATITNALSYYDYADRQDRAAEWLKPNYEDKNVSPWQMADFVNDQVTELDVSAKVRYGGNRELLKRLIANNFPVIIEEGYDPPSDPQGWMGHYLLMTGYDDTQSLFYTYDSYLGPDHTYPYDEIDTFWQHFNYVYIVLYPSNREEELNAILGQDADEQQNIARAFERARAEAIEDNADAYAWFNMGTNLVMQGKYAEAATAYDQARTIGLPWRMMWYQFGPFEAYYHMQRYDDMLDLAVSNLNDGGGQYVEETYYYAGLARIGQGDLDREIWIAPVFNLTTRCALIRISHPRRWLSIQLGGND